MPDLNAKPHWLEQALSERKTQAHRPRARAGEPKVGQLRIIRAMDSRTRERRLALIVEIVPAEGIARVLLTSNLVELGAAADYVLAPGEAGTTFSLIVETDLIGAVFFHQLDETVGMVDRRVATALESVGAGRPAGDVGLSAGRLGLPARDERDSRWNWKLSELDVLRSFTVEAERALDEDENVPAVVDVWAIVRAADLLRDDPDQGRGCLDRLLSAASAREAVPPLELIEPILGVLDHSSPDFAAAIEPLINASLSSASAPGQLTETGVRWHQVRPGHPGAKLLGSLLTQRFSGGDRRVSLLTSRSLWGATNTREKTAIVESDDSGRVQVQYEFVD